MKNKILPTCLLRMYLETKDIVQDNQQYRSRGVFGSERVKNVTSNKNIIDDFTAIFSSTFTNQSLCSRILKPMKNKNQFQTCTLKDGTLYKHTKQ